MTIPANPPLSESRRSLFGLGWPFLVCSAVVGMVAISGIGVYFVTSIRSTNEREHANDRLAPGSHDLHSESEGTRARKIDYQRFYKELFAPLEAEFGMPDKNGLFAIMGFDGGGPLNFSTFNYDRRGKPITYVSCELAVRPEQQSSEFGRFELLCTCDNEQWVRKVLSDIGRMSLDETFGDSHSLDLGTGVEPTNPIQGVLFEKICSVTIDGEEYGVLRCIGITRPEMEFKRAHGAEALIRRFRMAGIYPRTILDRESVVESDE